MRFQFPQFLDTSASLIGPLNVKQFIYVVVAAFMVFFLQFVLSPGSLLVAAIILGGISIALGFIRVEGVPLPTYINNAFLFIFNRKRYTFIGRQSQDNEDIITNNIQLTYNNETVSEEDNQQ